jgi:hypothetical protein
VSIEPELSNDDVVGESTIGPNKTNPEDSSTIV